MQIIRIECTINKLDKRYEQSYLDVEHIILEHEFLRGMMGIFAPRSISKISSKLFLHESNSNWAQIELEVALKSSKNP